VAYDEGLEERIRQVVGDDPSYTAKKLFGGLCFLCDGNMCFGILGDELMVRVGREAYAAALARPHAREMDFTSRPMRGMVMVASDGCAEDADLRDWLGRGTSFARSLPPK
jgi:TfoX/Sxy family transcriptional regulator of competence genes